MFRYIRSVGNMLFAELVFELIHKPTPKLAAIVSQCRRANIPVAEISFVLFERVIHFWLLIFGVTSIKTSKINVALDFKIAVLDAQSLIVYLSPATHTCRSVLYTCVQIVSVVSMFSAWLVAKGTVSGAAPNILHDVEQYIFHRLANIGFSWMANFIKLFVSLCTQFTF